MKANEVFDGKRSGGIGTALVVAELNFDSAGRKNLDRGSCLAAHQSVLGLIPQQCDFGKQVELWP